MVKLERRRLSRGLKHATAVLAWGALSHGASSPAWSQDIDLSTEAYLEPSAAVLEAVTAPWHENVSLSNLSPDGRHFLITIDDGMPPLERLARPYFNLGEMTIDHLANRSRRLTTRNSVGYAVRTVDGNETRSIRIPNGARVSSAQWSPDGSMIGFLAHTADATHIFVADVETGQSRRLTRRPVNAVHVNGFDWTGDSSQILAVLVPDRRGEMPQPPAVAGEPQVRLHRDGETPTRVYRFLMKSPYDFELYEWLSTGQLALINVSDQTVTAIGEPRMFQSADVSPSGDLFRVSTVLKPFVYHATANSFGNVEEIWNAEGNVIHEVRRREVDDEDDETVASRSVDDWIDFERLNFEVAGGLDWELFEQQQRPARGQDRPGQASEDDDEMRDIRWRPDGNGISFIQLEPQPESKEEADASNDDGADQMQPDQPRRGQRGARPQGQRRPGNARGPRGQDARPRQRQATGDQTVRFLGIPIQVQESESEPEQPRRDRIMQWTAPYSEEEKAVVYSTDGRINSVLYSDDCRWLFITETKDDEQQRYAVHLDDPDLTRHELKVRDDGNGAQQQRPQFAGRGGRGGGRGNTPMMRPGPLGETAVRMSPDGNDIYYQGTEQPDEETADQKNHPRPYIDRYTIESGETVRVFMTDGTMTERISAIVGDDISIVYTTRESRKDVPNFFRYDVAGDCEAVQVTENIDFLPDVTQAKRDRFQVTRVDGYTFWVNVTMPRDYGKELPAMIWFYPREYTSQEQYDQRANGAGDTDTFPRVGVRSMEILTRIGYVVVQPDLPIFGDEGRMNDNYVQDLRNGLWAVIDELDKREIIDRDRIGLGGHSYGAFGTANAMIHTPFFKAGIAGDGNYNRTLTPMAFQSERRFLWDARETYLSMSPLLWANQLNGALLMYHGAEDPNTGTHPFHAIRMFEALDGLGKDVALYRYPYEEHGPLAKETVLDLWARWEQWLDKYVKHAGVEE